MPTKIIKTALSFLLLAISVAVFSFVLALFENNLFLLFEFSADVIYFFLYLLLSFAFLTFSASLMNILVCDWKIKIAVVVLASLAFFINPDFSSFNLLNLFILVIGLLLFIWQVNRNLRKKLDFDIKAAFLAPQRRLEFFLIIVTAISFYNIFNFGFKDKDFEIPLRLIEPITKMVISFGGQGMEGLSGHSDQNMFSQPGPDQQMPSQEEMQKMLEEMQKSGKSPIPGVDLSKIDLSKIDWSKIDPSKYGQVEGIRTGQPSFPQSDLPNELSEIPDISNIEGMISQQIKNQIDRLIGPYKNFISIGLALLLFLTLLPFRTPIIWVTFLILSGTIKLLEKLKVIEFVKEMVEVRRLKIE